MIFRNNTHPYDIGSALYLYFSGLSTRGVAKALSFLKIIEFVTTWKWIQKYKPQKISSKRKKIKEFAIDKTLIKVGSPEYIWLWIIIEPEINIILDSAYKEINMLIAERFVSILVKAYGPHLVSTDGKITW